MPLRLRSPDTPPSPTTPRPVSAAAFARSRLRRSPVLKACAALAFVEYGALAMWAVFGRSSEQAGRSGVWFAAAGWLALCSLGSWFFLFLWFPYLQTLQGMERGDGSALRIGRVLETFAIACVAVVHVMIALTLYEGLRH